jgi:ferredoxin
MTISKTVVIIGCVFLFGITAFAAKKVVTHVIDQSSCNQCGECVKSCPEKAIKVSTKDGKKIHEIDPALCNQCGLCIDNCPLEAISAVEPKGDAAAQSGAKKKR